MKGLRWAQGQGEHGHGTPWHIVVEDVYDNPQKWGMPKQKTACGRYLVQADEMSFGHYLEYLIKRADEEFVPVWKACPKCWDFHQGAR